MGYQQQLADETHRVLAEHKWSRAAAQIQTGLSRSTIQNMSQGLRPSAESVVKWAKAIHEDVAKWLRLAGYDYVGGAFEGNEPQESPAPAPAPVPEETREPILDDEEEEVISFYRGMAEQDRDTVRALLKLLAEKRARGEIKEEEG